jgi:hypothetical protein
MNKLTSILPQDIKITKSLSFGNVFVLNEVAIRLQMDKVLGSKKQGKLALWQAIVYLIASSSRSCSGSPALDLAHRHAIHGILGLSHISEHEIEENWDWLLSKQDCIEEAFGKLKAKRDSFDYLHPGFEVVEMLAMVLMEYLKKAWRCIARTVQQELTSLALVTVIEISVTRAKRIMVSTPHLGMQERLDMLGIKLPKSVSVRICKVKRTEGSISKAIL